MSRYANDPRVIDLVGGGGRVQHGNHWWEIRLEAGVWNTYTHFGQRCEEASGRATADEAIHAVIGDPQ